MLSLLLSYKIVTCLYFDQINMLLCWEFWNKVHKQKFDDKEEMIFLVVHFFSLNYLLKMKPV